MFVSVDLMRRAALLVGCAILLVVFGAAHPALGTTIGGALIDPGATEGDPLDSNDYSDPGSAGGGGDSDDDLYLPPSQVGDRFDLHLMPVSRDHLMRIIVIDSGLGLPVVRVVAVGVRVSELEARYAR